MKNLTIALSIAFVSFSSQSIGGRWPTGRPFEPRLKNSVCVEKLKSFEEQRKKYVASIGEATLRFHERRGLDAEILEWGHAFRHRLKTRMPSAERFIKDATRFAPYGSADLQWIKNKIVEDLQKLENTGAMRELYGEFLDNADMPDSATLKLRRGLWNASDIQYEVSSDGHFFVKFSTAFHDGANAEFLIDLTDGRLVYGATGSAERLVRNIYEDLAKSEKNLINASPLLNGCLKTYPLRPAPTVADFEKATSGVAQTTELVEEQKKSAGHDVSGGFD